MSAGGALQSAIVSVLQDVTGLAGVFDGAPARAAFPYVSVDAGSEGDWSHKSGDGREVGVALTLWDDQPARLHDLADEIETRLLSVKIVEGWQLVTLRFVRRRTVRDVSGPWAAAMDFRARLLAAI